VQFYAQAAHGQWELLHKARPIREVLADPATKPDVHAKLQFVEELRDYARTTLHLPVDKQFRDYSDLGRKYAVWVVFAAPEFSVEAKGWWYPLVGTLKYRGFFSEAAAKAEGDRLKAQGYDVYVGGTDAYSTLGWFADPVLNTFLRRSDAELAELIFHELTHARVFLPGDTEFNEALATAVAEASVRRWLQEKNKPGLLADYNRDLAKDREIIHLLLDTRTRLQAAYATPGDHREQKQRLFKEMEQRYATIRQRWQGDSRYDRFFAKPMNNARLNTVATYFDLVPGFERLLRECHGDLDLFFTRLEAMKSMPRDQRRKAVNGDPSPARE
jgi:predicted aminopeptidase